MLPFFLHAGDPCSDLAVRRCAIHPSAPVKDPSGITDGPGLTWEDLRDKFGGVDAIRNVVTDEAKKRASSFSHEDLSKSASLIGLGNCQKESCRPLLEKWLADFSMFRLSGGRVRTPQFGEGQLRNMNSAASSPLLSSAHRAIGQRLQKQFAGDQRDRILRDRLFPKIKEFTLQTVNEMLPEGPERNKIVARVKSTTFGKAQNCWGPLDVGAGYDTRGRVEVCPGLMNMGNSDFRLVQILGHELGHSFGPRAAKDVYYKDGTPLFTLDYDSAERRLGYYSVVRCLRGEKSLNAQPLGIQNRWALFEFDQIEEGFADYVGTEVLVKFIKSEYPNVSRSEVENILINAFRYLDCRDKPTVENDLHSVDTLRFSNVALAHPWIRKKLGCSPPPQGAYCGETSGEDLNKKTRGRL